MDEEHVRGNYHDPEANEDAGPAVAARHLAALTGRLYCGPVFLMSCKGV